MTTLNTLRCHEEATVVRIDTNEILKRRLMDMGVTKGVRLRVRRFAPLGDPMLIDMMGYSLSIRKSDAKYIIVEKTGEETEK